jgi:lipopolysaccharide biosynthesis protein
MIFEEGTDVKRLAIFFFYDEQGIVDDYIPYMLEDLKENLKELLVVSNGKLTEESKQKLKEITPNILERENKGFDVWAYKAGIEHYGWKELEKYDEVILMNYTIFGPLYPFKVMFEDMNKRDVDFWGITKHHKVDYDAFGTCKYGYIPEHIQSSFLVIRKSLLSSKDYQEFWENMPMINSYADSVGYYEAIFTIDFKEKGYKEEVYVNTEDLRDHTRYPLMMMSYELVKNRKCPVIKRKSFSQSYFDILSETVGEATLELYEYIRNNTNYDINLIWDNILRTCHMSDIKDIMHLNYILPERCLLPQKNEVNKKVALVLHMYFTDLIEYCFNYACYI